VGFVLAYANRFIQDDAYISFRYAYNLVNGDGLVYNAGERVEGYTNFLWTLLMAIPMLFGRDAVVFSQALGLLCFAGTLLAAYNLARLVFRSTFTAALAVLFLGTSYTFSSYATGGLETQLQACLITWAVFGSFAVIIRGATVVRLAALSLVFAAALLTRLDSAAALVLPAGYVLFHLLRARGGEPGERWRRTAGFVAPGASAVGLWLLWKYLYYGELLPNSYYAKASGGVTSIERGWWYVYHYFRSYWLYPFLVLVPFRYRAVLGDWPRRVMSVTLVLWLLYVIKVGGDFMEFRFMVPVMPLGMILLAAVFVSLRKVAVIALLAAGVVAGSISHQITYDLENEIASIYRLNRFVMADAPDWTGAGKTLGRLFRGHEDGVTIATTAAGAIPYYSRLRTVDMLGLNDKWVARNGVVMSTRPGHQKFAPFDYLLQRNVNLVISHPRVKEVGVRAKSVYTVYDIERMFNLVKFRRNKLYTRSCIVEIQINPTLNLWVLYLTPNPVVDEVIRKENLRIRRIYMSR
jgi:hypothetical protein